MCGSGSNQPKSKRIHSDPDPQNWLPNVIYLFLTQAQLGTAMFGAFYNIHLGGLKIYTFDDFMSILHPLRDNFPLPMSIPRSKYNDERVQVTGKNSKERLLRSDFFNIICQ
jgi:hypothetical protein